MINAHKEKYHDLYWSIADSASKQSVAERKKVGACIVTTTGMIAVGWNGMPSGLTNVCEWQCEDGKGYDTGRTKPEVIHAERNALDKLTREGITPCGAIIFITLAPCLECAKSLYSVGVESVYYRDDYKTSAGIEFLRKMGVSVFKKQH